MQTLLSALLLSLPFLALAQPGMYQGTPEEIAERQTAQMIEQLELDEEQTVLVREINLANAIKVKAAREKNQGNFELMRAAMTSLREERNKHLREVLTETQYQKHETMQAQQMESRKRPSGN